METRLSNQTKFKTYLTFFGGMRRLLPFPLSLAVSTLRVNSLSRVMAKVVPAKDAILFNDLFILGTGLVLW